MFKEALQVMGNVYGSMTATTTLQLTVLRPPEGTYYDRLVVVYGLKRIQVRDRDEAIDTLFAKAGLSARGDDSDVIAMWDDPANDGGFSPFFIRLSDRETVKKLLAVVHQQDFRDHPLTSPLHVDMAFNSREYSRRGCVCAEKGVGRLTLLA